MLLGLSLVLIGAVWLLIRYKGTGSVSPATKALRIPEKREDIIARIERSRPSNTMDPYYIENLTEQCLQEIGQAEGWSSSAPLCGGDLWKWKSGEDIPKDRRGPTKDLAQR